MRGILSLDSFVIDLAIKLLSVDRILFLFFFFLRLLFPTVPHIFFYLYLVISNFPLLQIQAEQYVKEMLPAKEMPPREMTLSETAEPRFQTTKEKECWHLYRRMCDKGVCVSFDTVLR